MKETKNTYSIEEARRYVANAEDVIKKAGYDPEIQSYTDSKYVRTAGDILWKGCLIALDTVFQVRKGKGRPSVDKYRDAVAKRDRKLLSFVNNGYDVTHLHMGYDGTTDKKICDRGFEITNVIINHCAMLLPKPVCA
ncbi:MAG: DUF5618 family protein [Bacteroidales bacterium]|nr:DUF5618 family protein [Bacteroidales bacterium]